MAYYGSRDQPVGDSQNYQRHLHVPWQQQYEASPQYYDSTLYASGEASTHRLPATGQSSYQEHAATGASTQYFANQGPPFPSTSRDQAELELDELEHEANDIVLHMKYLDQQHYHTSITEEASQEDSWLLEELLDDNEVKFGGRFLNNKPVIEKTRIYELALAAPKGAHLHIHFNSCLGPEVLLGIATDEEVKPNMYISTNLQGPLTLENLDEAKIQFHYLPRDTKSVSLFDHRYRGRQDATQDVRKYDKMQFSRFLHSRSDRDIFPNGSPMDWLMTKLVFQPEEVTYVVGSDENAAEYIRARQWRLFDNRTQMMKGLFSYEYAYTRYTRLFLEKLVAENVQYAEIRLNFMPTNQVKCHGNPDDKRDNIWILGMLFEELRRFKLRHSHFGGLKVIYCCPRSFEPEKVMRCMQECIRFKQHAVYGPLIAGFDLIGPERPGKSMMSNLYELSNWFQDECKRLRIHIPLLLHCGESIADPYNNLETALALRPKRIAHGFALGAKKGLMSQLRKDGICVETCPISNEILGLAPLANQAIVHQLIAMGVPCALGADNPTLFSSTLAHDFYQVMVGHPDSNLFTWKKLMKDSLAHAVWNTKEERTSVEKIWTDNYRRFLNEICAGDFYWSSDLHSQGEAQPDNGDAGNRNVSGTCDDSSTWNQSGTCTDSSTRGDSTTCDVSGLSGNTTRDRRLTPIPSIRVQEPAFEDINYEADIRHYGEVSTSSGDGYDESNSSYASSDGAPLARQPSRRPTYLDGSEEYEWPDWEDPQRRISLTLSEGWRDTRWPPEAGPRPDNRDIWG